MNEDVFLELLKSHSEEKYDGCWMQHKPFEYNEDHYKIGRCKIRVYETINGKIKGGRVIDMSCYRRKCINPAHMHITTQTQRRNIQVKLRSMAKARRLRKEQDHKDRLGIVGCKYCSVEYNYNDANTGIYFCSLTCALKNSVTYVKFSTSCWIPTGRGLSIIFKQLDGEYTFTPKSAAICVKKNSIYASGAIPMYICDFHNLRCVNPDHLKQANFFEIPVLIAPEEMAKAYCKYAKENVIKALYQTTLTEDLEEVEAHSYRAARLHEFCEAVEKWDEDFPILKYER